jgi:hypothetical protein
MPPALVLDEIGHVYPRFLYLEAGADNPAIKEAPVLAHPD